MPTPHKINPKQISPSQLNFLTKELNSTPTEISHKLQTDIKHLIGVCIDAITEESTHAENESPIYNPTREEMAEQLLFILSDIHMEQTKHSA
jgi:hypothetical protein